MACAYRLLALDLDGTLLNRKGAVSPQNVEAVRRARRAGVTVMICTARGLVEARSAVDAIGQTDPMIVAGGAMCVDPKNGRALYREPIDPTLVADVSSLLISLGHRVLLLKDSEAAGYDYLAVGDAPYHAATSWWFDELGIRVREVRHPDDDPHPEHSIRLGIVTTPDEMYATAARIRERCGDRALVQHFPAVSGDTDGGPDVTIEILEVFDPAVNKWNGIAWIAEQWGIAVEETAAIGDEINDLEMIRRAGLGIAMENAADAVRAVADQVTLDHDEHGVAYAIHQMLSGAW